MTSVQSRRLSVEREIDGRGMEEGEKWVKKGEEGRGGNHHFSSKTIRLWV